MTWSNIGQAIATLRRRRRISQRQLAAHAGISVSLIQKLESGERSTARLDSLTALANALDVSVGDLTGKPRGLAVDANDSEILKLRSAILTGRTPAAPDPDLDPAAHLPRLWHLYWHGRYAQLARDLPDLIAAARAGAADTGRAPAYTTLADILQLTGSLLAHLSHEDLALLALHGAAGAATAAGDELGHCAVQAVRAWVMSRLGLWSESERLAVTTADQMSTPNPSRPDQVAVWGELLRYATVALSRGGRHREAAEVLDRMRPAAATVPAGAGRAGMPFGPTVVAMRDVGLAAAAGRPRRALTLAAQIPNPHLWQVPPAMHTRYLVTVAQVQTQAWLSTDAVRTLCRAEQVSPGAFAHQTLARAVIGELLPRRRRQRLPGLADLARRSGLNE